MVYNYRVFAIQCTKNNKKYIGITTTENGNNLLKWMINQNKSDQSKFKELAESVKVNGFGSHIVIRLKEVFDNKHDAEQKSYAVQCMYKEKDELMNTDIINPEREQCNCGQFVKKVFMDIHKEKYCNCKLQDEIEEQIKLL